MTNFTAVERRVHLLARSLLRDGFDAHLVHDAFITNGLSLWAANTGHSDAARNILTVWATIRDNAPEARYGQ